MSFTREKFYGLDLEWYAIDTFGFIGKFTTGYGPIPKIVFDNEKIYDSIIIFFKELKMRSEAKLIKSIRKRQAKGDGNYQDALEESKKGIYIYDFKDCYGPYELIAYPLNNPLKIEQLPLEISSNLLKFSFSFSDKKNLSISKSERFIF